MGEGYLGTWCCGERDPDHPGKAEHFLRQGLDNLAAWVANPLSPQTRFKPWLDALLHPLSWGTRDPNPHGQAAPILLKAFDELAAFMDGQLMAQTVHKPLYDAIGLTWNAAGNGLELDVSGVASLLRANYDANAVERAMQLSDFAANLKTMGEFGEQVLGKLRAAGDLGGGGLDLLLGSAGRTLLRGDANGNILAGAEWPGAMTFTAAPGAAAPRLGSLTWLPDPGSPAMRGGATTFVEFPYEIWGDTLPRLAV